MASIWTLQLIKQTSNNSIAGECKQLTSASWLNKETHIHLCLLLLLLLRQDAVDSRGRCPAQGVGVHLIAPRVWPQPLRVNQSLSPDQHDPGLQWRKRQWVHVDGEKKKRGTNQDGWKVMCGLMRAQRRALWDSRCSVSLGVLNLTYFCQYSAKLMDTLLKIPAGLDKSDSAQKRECRAEGHCGSETDLPSCLSIMPSCWRVAAMSCGHIPVALLIPLTLMCLSGCL